MARRITQTSGIYRRGEVYWLNFQRKGKRQFISLDTSDFVEAVKRAAAIRADPELMQSNLFRDEIEAFLAHKLRKNEFTRASVETRRYVLQKFVNWSGLSSPIGVTSAHVTQFYNAQLAGLRVSTANGYLMVLRSFFTWAMESAKIVRRNPCDEIELARDSGAGRKEFCTAAQRDLLISTCGRDDLKFVLFCGFHAGLRKNEIIEARPFWFDLDAGLLHLRKTATMQFKDREERTIPLTAEFHAFLRGYGLREPFMLQPDVKHGANRYRYDFTRPFNEHVKAHGLDWVTPHIMRHTFASLLASAGVSLYKIAKWLGDDPRVVESRYAKLLPNDPDIERAFHKPGSASPAASLSTQ